MLEIHYLILENELNHFLDLIVIEHEFLILENADVFSNSDLP